MSYVCCSRLQLGSGVDGSSEHASPRIKSTSAKVDLGHFDNKVLAHGCSRNVLIATFPAFQQPNAVSGANSLKRTPTQFCGSSHSIRRALRRALPPRPQSAPPPPPPDRPQHKRDENGGNCRRLGRHEPHTLLLDRALWPRESTHPKRIRRLEKLPQKHFVVQRLKIINLRHYHLEAHNSWQRASLRRKHNRFQHQEAALLDSKQIPSLQLQSAYVPIARMVLRNSSMSLS